MSDVGIESRLAAGPARFLGWSDITEIEYSLFTRQLVLKGNVRGQALRVSSYVRGASDLVTALRHYVTADVLARGEKALSLYLDAVQGL